MATKTPSIRSPQGIKDKETRDVLKSIKETIDIREGRLGDRGSKAVTYDDLVTLGLITEGDIP